MKFALALIFLFVALYAGWQMLTLAQRSKFWAFARRHVWPITAFTGLVGAALYAAALTAGIRIL